MDLYQFCHGLWSNFETLWEFGPNLEHKWGVQALNPDLGVLGPLNEFKILGLWSSSPRTCSLRGVRVLWSELGFSLVLGPFWTMLWCFKGFWALFAKFKQTLRSSSFRLELGPLREFERLGPDLKFSLKFELLAQPSCLERFSNFMGRTDSFLIEFRLLTRT